MGNNGSSRGSSGSSARSDFNYCVAKNTFNGNGFRGSAGDLATVSCVIDRMSSRAASRATGPRRKTRNE